MKTHAVPILFATQSKFTLWLSCIVSAIVLFGASISSSQADLLIVSNTNFEPTSVLRYDQTSGAFLGVFVPPGSGGLANGQGSTFGPDGNLYIASFASHNILRYNGVTGAFIDVFVPSGSGGLGGPSDVTFGPDGNLYVADGFYGTYSILRYNGHTGAFIDVFAAGGGIEQPQHLTFSPDGNLFVTNASSSNVLRYHGDTGLAYPAADQSGAIFVLGIKGTCIDFGPDGNLYVGSGASPDILRYDGNTGAFLGTFVPNGADAGSYFRFSPDGNLNLYITEYFEHSVRRYNGTTGAFIDTFVASGSGGLGAPASLVFTPPFSYTFTGFFPPVDNPPIFNQAKAGSGIPVKFSLKGNQGMAIFAAGYPGSRQVSCQNSAPIDPIEETVTAGSSSLTYDPATDMYNYIWKTDKTWAGSCRELNVKLIDGTSHTALFNFAN